MFLILCAFSVIASFALLLFWLKEFRPLKRRNVYLEKLNENLLSQISEKEIVLERYKSKREDILNVVESTITNERNRIAYELHDDTIQRLLAIRFRLERLTWYSLPDQIEIEINSLRNELNDIVKGIRYLINKETQAQFENETITQLIEKLLTKFKPIFFPKISFTTYNAESEFAISPNVKKELFHLAQEVIQNSVKHSAGTELTVNVLWGERLTIDVSDNGIGFLSSDKEGIGRRTMNERAKRIGVTIKNVKRIGGAQIQIILPKADLNQSVSMSVGN